MSRILLVEDEAVIRTELRRFLTRSGHEIAEAASVREAQSDHELTSFDLVIADLRLPGEPGTALIPHVQGTPVLIMTSYATVRSAVDAMKAGAADYISKPFDHDELLLVVERLVQHKLRLRQTAALKSEVERVWPVDGMIGACQAMQDVFDRIRKVAPTSSTVLILGESGTGKELVARAVHRQSPRREAPFIAVNCAAIPDGLIESELFGHEKGAFTGAVAASSGLVEAADGGTLFLDEIGELPAAAQARLLRVLQEGEVRRVGSARSRKVDVRMLAATHRDLPQQLRDGRFREDLYFRLRVLEIRLPPLRERKEDLLPLADFLLAQACKRLNRPLYSFAPDARDAIAGHRWPGNVRELDNAIERAVILADSDQLTEDLLALAPEQPVDQLEASPSLIEYFKRFVQEHQEKLSETELARRLGISRKALWERRIRFSLPRPK
ncbi:MAG: sigma-54-dependent Fis family transcriptional regulator [Deltaproteobacteria bacterium]|nr:sigma-54-dependent Fis family transcriptional regulator [Deltaproteobacteria bacterium]